MMLMVISTYRMNVHLHLQRCPPECAVNKLAELTDPQSLRSHSLQVKHCAMSRKDCLRHFSQLRKMTHGAQQTNISTQITHK